MNSLDQAMAEEAEVDRATAALVVAMVAALKAFPPATQRRAIPRACRLVHDHGNVAAMIVATLGGTSAATSSPVADGTTESNAPPVGSATVVTEHVGSTSFADHGHPGPGLSLVGSSPGIRVMHPTPHPSAPPSRAKVGSTTVSLFEATRGLHRPPLTITDRVAAVLAGSMGRALQPEEVRLALDADGGPPVDIATIRSTLLRLHQDGKAERPARGQYAWVGGLVAGAMGLAAGGPAALPLALGALGVGLSLAQGKKEDGT